MPHEELPYDPQDPREFSGDPLGVPNASSDRELTNGVSLPPVVEESAESRQEAGSEAEKLRTMLGEYVDVIGEDVELVSLGEAGYMVRLGKRPPSKFGDWVLYDLDDTMLGYSEAKTVRQQHYETYLANCKIALDPTDAKTLLDITDKLARWDEKGRETYHIDAHISVLARLSEVVAHTPEADRETLVTRLKESVTRAIKDRPSTAPDDLPFYFSNGRVVIKDGSPGADRENELYDTVFDAMIRPEKYQDVIDASVKIGKETEGKPYGVNQGLLTYGKPDFQLRKVLELLRTEYENGNEIPVSTILLSSVAKGAFFEELLKYDPVTNPSESNNSAPAQFIGEAARTILLVDDSPDEAESFLSTDKKGYGEVRPGLGIAIVRYRHPGTKNFDATWKVDGDHLPEKHLRAVRNTHRLLSDLDSEIYESLRLTVVYPRTRGDNSDEWDAIYEKYSFYDKQTLARERHYWLYADYGSDYAQKQLQRQSERYRSVRERYELRRKMDH